MNDQTFDKYLFAVAGAAFGVIVALTATAAYVYTLLLPELDECRSGRRTVEENCRSQIVAAAAMAEQRADECEARQQQAQAVAVTATVALPPTHEPAPPPDGPYPDPELCRVDDIRAIFHGGDWHRVVVRACPTLGPTDTPFTIIGSNPGLGANHEATVICNGGKAQFGSEERVFICAFQ